MSIKSLDALFDRMVKDEAFAIQIESCGNIDTRIAFARMAGYEIAIEDLALVGVDISDEDLIAVLEG